MSQQINLFNPIFLKQKKYFSAVTMAQALGLILIGCLGLGAFANFQLAALAKDAKATSAQLAQVQAQLNQVSATAGSRQKDSVLEEAVRHAETEVQSLQQVTEVLKKEEFSNTRGYAEQMRAFARQIVNGVWLTGFTIDDAGTEIGLQGRALRPDLVPMYINRLKLEPVLRGKSFDALDMQAVQPPVQAGNKTDVAAAGTRGPASYIEFSLQSSATGGAKDAPGANNK